MEKKNISAVVLAGGNSSRMGQDKALLNLGKKKMIEVVVDILRPLFEEIIIVTDRTDLKDNGVRFVKDRMKLKKKSSIVGLYTGLWEAKNDYIFVTACDMPLLNSALIQYMIEELNEEDILIPYVEGFYEPLHSIYSKNCVNAIENLLAKKDYKILNLFDEVKVRRIEENKIRLFDPDLESFKNINTVEDYEQINRRYFKNHI